MVTPLDYGKEVYSKVKQAVYPNPDISRLQAETETEEADRNFRTLNYNKPVVKPKPIKLSPKISSGKVDVGGKR